MIIGVFGGSKAREEFAKAFPRPFIVSFGQVDANLQHPGPHDLALLASWLLQRSGIKWATPKDTMPAHDFRLKLGQLDGRPLTDVEREQVTLQFREASTRLKEAKATPPLSVIINSAEDWWFSLYRTMGQPTAEWLIREALEWLSTSTPVVLISGQRPRYQCGEVIGYEPNYPPVIERYVDLSLEVTWEADLHTEASVYDLRPAKVPGLTIGQSVTVSDILSLLGHPIDAQDIKKD